MIIVPFDTKTLPDVYVSVGNKMFWKFPDDVGRPGSNISQELWIQDNHIIQFNSHSLYYVDIKSRKDGSVSLNKVQDDINTKLWFVKTFMISKKFQAELNRVARISPEIVQLIQAYFDIITTITLSFMSYEQKKRMEENIKLFERMTNVMLEGRKWMMDRQEVTWGNMLYAILRSYGMNKVW